MLEIIASGLINLLPSISGQQPAKLEKINQLSWQQAEIFTLPTQPDRQVEEIVEQYIQNLATRRSVAKYQGVWLQSDWVALGNHRGKVPVSAASLTKIATTLAALQTWGTSYQFETLIYATGKIEHGTLQGDLLIRGSGDPLFVWEEAIALGNALNQLGIRRVRGNLVIVGDFYMNFKARPGLSGRLLRQGLNSRLWPSMARKQYRSMPEGTPRPQLEIFGTVQLKNHLPVNAKLILRHKSLTLAQILKQMNIYSNNAIAEMLADSLGGASVVAKITAAAAQVPAAEIQLINGSGLGVDNRISPRAVCAMLMAIERHLHSQSLSAVDLLPLAGRDFKGTIETRNIPTGTAVKTGTLAQVSSLAGVIPTRERGLVWFAIINHGSNIEMFRSQQDQLLQSLSEHWQLIPTQGSATNIENSTYLGDSSRNIQVQ